MRRYTDCRWIETEEIKAKAHRRDQETEAVFLQRAQVEAEEKKAALEEKRGSMREMKVRRQKGGTTTRALEDMLVRLDTKIVEIEEAILKLKPKIAQIKGTIARLKQEIAWMQIAKHIIAQIDTSEVRRAEANQRNNQEPPAT
ncbi:hypothetical protein H0H81_009491 [Sphagnurus paluster]|uniref:Uncharacterized protein n=1 Tax=Sphagnurus paluster TaxID=117069 RepID=A0A9P7GQ24_9AGAR|nr:hypothetical protein H0H81_009491 [Sphagnurus paluster]